LNLPRLAATDASTLLPGEATDGFDETREDFCAATPKREAPNDRAAAQASASARALELRRRAARACDGTAFIDYLLLVESATGATAADQA
jgi:hypothetical protein